MKRALTAVCLGLVALCAPAASAEAPGYTPVGPPASLNTVVFAANGVVYGTVGSHFGEPATSAALWRSTDHGRTWSVRYRPPPGSSLVVLAVSPADPNAVYVSMQLPGRGGEFDRIDAGTGRAVPLPIHDFYGVDAAGTAYGQGFGRAAPPSTSVTLQVVRCPRASDACSSSPLTQSFNFPPVVDPNSTGVLAAPLSAPGGLQVETSLDGGATWTAGTVLPLTGCGCRLQFAGPAPRTLYTAPTGSVAVSHDAGQTWATSYAAPDGAEHIVGSRPAVAAGVFETSAAAGALAFSSDEGASYTSVPLPVPGSVLAIDPTDPSHLFLAEADGTVQSWDAGRTSLLVTDARFGVRSPVPRDTVASGNDIYTVLDKQIWVSGDRGETWERTPWAGSGLVVSRDDPRTAYASTSVDGVNRQLRTRDGGHSWDVLPDPLSHAVTAIAIGDPLHVFSSGAFESLDGGTIWTAAGASGCSLTVVDDAASATGKRIVCDHYAADGSVTSVSAVSPGATGVVGAPGAPGALAVAWGPLLGDVPADGTWTPLLAPTDVFGPVPPDASALAAWPAAGGTTFYAFDSRTVTTWVRRGTGRWWRLQSDGQSLSLVAPLDSTHALVAGGPRSPWDSGVAPLAVLDLTQPSVGEPVVKAQAGGFTCVVPWSIADASTTAYAWLRDGRILRGATRLQYRTTALDRGHDLTCRATATTAWGSTTVTSSLPSRVPGAPVAPARPHLTGAPLAGSLLRCSTGVRVTWLRDGFAVPGARARSYRVRLGDRGHAIACQTRRADGTLARSQAARIASPS